MDTQIWLPRYGRFTTTTLTPTGRRMLAVMGGRVDPPKSSYSTARAGGSTQCPAL